MRRGWRLRFSSTQYHTPLDISCCTIILMAYGFQPPRFAVWTTFSGLYRVILLLEGSAFMCYLRSKVSEFFGMRLDVFHCRGYQTLPRAGARPSIHPMATMKTGQVFLIDGKIAKIRNHHALSQYLTSPTHRCSRRIKFVKSCRMRAIDVKNGTFAAFFW